MYSAIFFVIGEGLAIAEVDGSDVNANAQSIAVISSHHAATRFGTPQGTLAAKTWAMV